MTDPTSPRVVVEDRTLAHVGVDVGGSKTHVQALDGDGRAHELVARSADWRRGPLFGDGANLVRLADLIGSLGDVGPGTVVAAGIHDCDTDEQMASAGAALERRLGCRVAVVNDATLLRYSTSERSTIEMIVGTGAIVSGTGPHGERVTADGHGWPVGDRGSAPDLVLAGVRAALAAADRGEPDADPLFAALRRAFSAVDAPALAESARDDLDPARWGAPASVLFDAWHGGSAAAHAIITDRADALAEHVALVRRRGAVATTVVAGGGVIVHQPRYEAAIRDRLAVHAPEVRLVVVRTPPVGGAVTLAGEIAAGL